MVEARQWDGSEEGALRLLAWIRADDGEVYHISGTAVTLPMIVIKLRNGAVLKAVPEDWIVREGWDLYEVWGPEALSKAFDPA